MARNYPVFNVEKSCEIIVKTVRNSQLNYAVQETPYSLYLTIRKSFAKNSSSSNSNPSFSDILDSEKSVVEEKIVLEKEVEKLKKMLKVSEGTNQILQENYEETLSDSEKCHEQIKNLQNSLLTNEQKVVVKGEPFLKGDRVELEKEFDIAEKNLRDLKKLVKIKDKEIHDLKRDNVNVSENLEEIKNKFATLTAKVNREKKTEEKKQKKRERKDFFDNLKTTANAPALNVINVMKT